MTRKDIKLIAGRIKQDRDLLVSLGGEANGSASDTLEWFTRSLAKDLAIDNPHFSTERFLVDCGIK